MDAAQLKAFLHFNVAREFREGFGVPDGPWIQRAVENWFDESVNYDRRWRVIDARRPGAGRILDVAAGCGTFMLYGLDRGRDVIGVEPEAWKREFYRQKIALAGRPARFIGRMLAAVGEALPLADESVDLVTTYQTLEHVRDMPACIREMLRVLRPGGALYLRAPDYNCFFEPHYRLPFLPCMDRRLAAAYLRLLGRPLGGLRSVNWTTERGVVAVLRRMPWRLRIEHNRDFFIETRRREIDARLGPLARRLGLARPLNELHQMKRQLASAAMTGRQERVIDLWVTKERERHLI